MPRHTTRSAGPWDWLPMRPAHLVALGPVAGLVSGTLSYLLQVWINPAIRTVPLGRYDQVLLFNIVVWTSWMALVPLACWLAWRVPIGRRIVAPFLFHTFVGLIVASAHTLFAASWKYVQLHLAGQRTWSSGEPIFWLDSVKREALFTLEWKFLLYWGIVGAIHAWRLHREVQDRELAESRLQARLAEAQLDALHRQLQPHFVLNTLHAIGTLMHRDLEAADTMIERLGRFLHAVMRSDMRHVVTLGEELALIREYIEIQKVRFGSRLHVIVDAPADLQNTHVPMLVLQPLVENAIKHGFGARPHGTIRISGRREDARLVLVVEDDGAGVPGGCGALTEGIGLANSRARLERLYPGAHELRCETPPGGGFRVTLAFPAADAAGGWTIEESSVEVA